MKIKPAKRLRGSRAKKHGCCRCRRHTSVVVTLRKKDGRPYNLCQQCAGRKK